MKIRSYSIIELMVVIALVALLASVAVRSYKNYGNTRIITNVVTKLNEIADIAYEQYLDAGTFDTAITYDGTAVNTYATVDFNRDNIRYLSYYAPTHYISNAEGAMIYAAVTGLSGIPGYQDPSVDYDYNSQHFQIVVLGLKIVNGNLEVRCGQKYPNNIDSSSIPLEYLPLECQCSNVTDWLHNGTSC